MHFTVGHNILFFKFDLTFHFSNFKMNIFSPSNNLDNVIKGKTSCIEMRLRDRKDAF